LQINTKVGLWTLSFLSLLLGIKKLGTYFFHSALNSTHQKAKLQIVLQTMEKLETTLFMGSVPSVEDWESLKKLPDPWGILLGDYLLEMRNEGNAILPILKRFKQFLVEQLQAIEESKVKSAQAFAQAFICLGLVPIFAGVLFLMLPQLSSVPLVWLSLVLGATMINGLGAIWILNIAQTAQWGGLKSKFRNWVFYSFCGGERFLAGIKAGYPPDLAWLQTCQVLENYVKELVLLWGSSIWQLETPPQNCGKEKLFLNFGQSMKQIIQVSLLEGSPCLKRGEALIESLKSDFKLICDREISLVGTHALKPLFLCIAPALVGLLLGALWICISHLPRDEGF